MIEFFMYAANPEVPDAGDISETAQRAGWVVKVLRDWKDWGHYELAGNGPLQDDDVTIGWLRNNELTTRDEIERAVLSRNEARIEELLRLFEVGTATWVSDYPFAVQSHLEFDGIEDARRQMGDAYASHIARTKRKYTILYCSHGDFLRLIAGVMAILTDGMIEDPQSAACAFPPPNAEKLADLCETWLTRW